MKDAPTLSGGEKSSLLWADSSPGRAKGWTNRWALHFNHIWRPACPHPDSPPLLSPPLHLKLSPFRVGEGLCVGSRRNPEAQVLIL